MKGVSVIICCYNSAGRLPETIKHIVTQQVPVSVPWEVIIVNNNSNDNTVEVANREWQQHDCKVPFCIVSETQAGLSFARAKGIATAKYEYLIFCDDDNWLNEKYISVAFEIMETLPKVGVAGGQGKAVCEISEPDWFESKKSKYAIGIQGEKSGDITSRSYVWGAGMVLRKSVIQTIYNAGIKSLLADRTGVSLASGGDAEICKWFILLGYTLRYDERLMFTHFMPKERLSEEYATKLYEGLADSAKIIFAYNRILLFKKDINKEGVLLLLIKALIKILLAKVHYRKFISQRFLRMQDLQLCLNSSIIYDQYLALVQKSVVIPLGKINI